MSILIRGGTVVNADASQKAEEGRAHCTNPDVAVMVPMEKLGIVRGQEALVERPVVN